MPVRQRALLTGVAALFVPAVGSLFEHRPAASPRVRSMSASAASTATAGVHSLLNRIENSLKEDLTGDPQSEYPNQETREVLGAHWVEVGPQPLPSPYLVSVSPGMAGSLGVDPQAEPEAFLRYFSGDVDCFETAQRPWATPYAVSVFGQAIPSPDPFGRGNAYGDGRACSLGEFVAEDGRRWELQLKGSGTTPFSRRGDGRAVLRSSVREYLVSEAMEAMGCDTSEPSFQCWPSHAFHSLLSTEANNVCSFAA